MNGHTLGMGKKFLKLLKKLIIFQTFRFSNVCICVCFIIMVKLFDTLKLYFSEKSKRGMLYVRNTSSIYGTSLKDVNWLSKKLIYPKMFSVTGTDNTC